MILNDFRNKPRVFLLVHTMLALGVKPHRQ